MGLQGGTSGMIDTGSIHGYQHQLSISTRRFRVK